MMSGTNGGKGEREEYFEGVTLVFLVTCIEACAIGGMVGGGGTVAPHTADTQKK
jgi:hypothetical protein